VKTSSYRLKGEEKRVSSCEKREEVKRARGLKSVGEQDHFRSVPLLWDAEKQAHADGETIKGPDINAKREAISKAVSRKLVEGPVYEAKESVQKGGRP